MSKKRPIVLISSNVIDYTGSPGHIVRETYIRSLLDISGAMPLGLPSIGRDFRFDDVRDVISGIVLTGSITNVAPACYGDNQTFDDNLLDLARDATTLPLIRMAAEANIPLLAICRGFQEMNVAFGGSLYQKVQEEPGMMDHRHNPSFSILQAYEARHHAVTAQSGGLFERIGITGRFDVNSVHVQGAKDLGHGLFVEAVADDGLVEAISVPGHKFALGLQWHPEGDTHISAQSRKIFEGFGQAIAS